MGVFTWVQTNFQYLAVRMWMAWTTVSIAVCYVLYMWGKSTLENVHTWSPNIFGNLWAKKQKTTNTHENVCEPEGIYYYAVLVPLKPLGDTLLHRVCVCASRI